MRLHLRPLRISQNGSFHPQLESQRTAEGNPESQQALVKTARDIQKPISLAALILIILLIVFYQIISKVSNVDQTILPTIVDWLGIISTITVVLAIASYIIPLFLKGRSGSLTVGAPTVTPPTFSNPTPLNRSNADSLATRSSGAVRSRSTPQQNSPQQK
jgi:hypothetical protein